ncbi:hypothetical protein [Dactylosporangium sp. NPDC048998]|uniref:hypothetical protein n=1 Tax=Dactylosporangium sp. NPDC048998 TaxID=3363976 RepID=UPI00372353CB
MDPVAVALRDLLSKWNEGFHGSVVRLAKIIEENAGEDVRSQLYRQLSGRPSWECVEWIIRYCRPQDGADDWADRQREVLAGWWYVERRIRPPGYVGSIIHDGREILPPVNSSSEAEDIAVQVVLLRKELEEAEALVGQYRAEAEELRDEVATLRTETVRLQGESLDKFRRVADNADTLIGQLRVVQSQLEDNHLAEATRLNDENRRLQDESITLRRERDEASRKGDRLAQELSESRATVETVRRQMSRTIDDLEQQVSNLHHQLDEARRASERTTQFTSESVGRWARPQHDRATADAVIGRDGTIRRQRDERG